MDSNCDSCPQLKSQSIAQANQCSSAAQVHEEIDGCKLLIASQDECDGLLTFGQGSMPSLGYRRVWKQATRVFPVKVCLIAMKRFELVLSKFSPPCPVQMTSSGVSDLEEEDVVISKGEAWQSSGKNILLPQSVPF
jgi:hypothetical protein